MDPIIESNEVIKAKAICKEFVKIQGLTLDQCMTTNPDGTLVFKLTFSMSEKDEAAVFFGVIPAKSKDVQDKILVWSDITTIESIPSLSRQEFFKAVLELNFLSDTAWCGVSKEGKITVKSERMIKGVDVDELGDMVKMTAQLALEVKTKPCVMYGVKTLGGADIPAVGQAAASNAERAAYAEILGKIQRKIMETIDSCRLALKDRDFQQCCKVYLKDTYDLIELIKKNGTSPAVIETIKEDLERAIGDIPYFPDNQKRYEMFYDVFQKILKVR